MSSKQNSPYYGRFKDLAWFNEMSKSTVMICGAGGIGSHLCFMIARAGAEVILIDNDSVDETNLAGQLFGKEDIGKSKVQAVSDVIDRLCGENKVNPIVERITPDKGQWLQFLSECNVVCAVFDNIASRKLVYEAWRKLNHRSPSLFVDGRMSAENGQVFTIQSTASPEKFKEYESNFFDDSEVVDQPCTAKATTHCGSLISSLITSQISNFLNNVRPLEKQGIRVDRSLVDKIEFHLPVSLFYV